MRVLLAGSTGAIGREIAAALRGQGCDIVAPVRAEGFDALDFDTIGPRMEGVDIVVSALGGSVALQSRERRPYAVTNTQANRNLLEAAQRAKVRRFVYVAAHKQSGYEGTAYIQSHEALVEELRDCRLTATVLRPTGVFTALAPFVGFARRGFVPLIGDGSAKTNPIHPRDVALAAVQYLEDGPPDVPLGGPETMSRRAIAEQAATAVGATPHFLSMPVGVARFNARAAGTFNKRIGELMAFAVAVSTHDCIAPARGRETLGDYFANFAKT